MPKLSGKSVKSAATAFVALVTATLVCLVGAPSAAAASAAGTRLAPKSLKASLLFLSNLPAGYQRVGNPTDAWLNIPPAFFDECQALTSTATPADTGRRTHVAVAAFARDQEETVLIELLAVTGDRIARAAVASTAAAWRRCPTSVISEADPRMTISHYRMKVPRLGDASAGVRYVLRMGNPEQVSHAMAITVALRGVYLKILVLGKNEPDSRELDRIARIAVAKLKRTR